MELERKKYWLIILGLLTGTVFDIFFYNKTLGISYPVFIILILAVLLLSFWGLIKKLNNIAWLLIIPILLLSLTFFIYSNQVLKILNYLIIPVLIIMLSTLFTNLNKADWSDIRFIGDLVKRIAVPFRFIHMPFVTLFRMTESDSAKGNKNRIVTKVLIGTLISIPILAAILLLLSSADIVFKNIFVNIPVVKIFKHFILIILISVYAICFLWSLLKAFGERNKSENKIVNNKIQWKLFLDPVILLTVLGLVNAVYTIFSFIQFAYLFGGKSFVLPSSLTYAEYARRGFAELVIVTVINFGILIFGITFVKKDNKKIFTTIKVFLTLLVIFTFILLVSAFYRMLVYEQAYGFTYLRIFVQAFMIMLFFLFIINIIYIWYSRLPIIKSYFIVSLAIYIIMNFANVDVIIAKNNVSRYFETGKIDIAYLNDLSYDAVPEMAKLYNYTVKSSYFQDMKLAESISVNFNERKSELNGLKDWQSFNISRNKAEKIIIGLSE